MPLATSCKSKYFPDSTGHVASVGEARKIQGREQLGLQKSDSDCGLGTRSTWQSGSGGVWGAGLPLPCKDPQEYSQFRQHDLSLPGVLSGHLNHVSEHTGKDFCP